MPRGHVDLRSMFMLLGLVLFSSLTARAADDTSMCSTSEGDLKLAACDRAITSGRLAGKSLARAYINRGEAYVLKSDPDRAFADFSNAIRLDPENSAAFAARGAAYLRNKNMDRAIVDLNEAIRLDSGYAQAYGARGNFYRQAGDLNRAIADFSEAIRLDPGLAVNYINRGLAYARKGEAEGARSDFSAVLKLSPKGDFGNNLVDTALEQLAVLPSSNPHFTAPSIVTKLPDKRVALIIGNSSYASVPRLENPARDAELVASSLREVGFDVTINNNLTRDNLLEQLRSFAIIADKADWALIYYAGHGIEMGGENFLIPVDAKLIADRDVTLEAISLNQVLSAVDGAKKLHLVVLDACRNNPFVNQMRRTTATRSVERGLARVEPDTGTLVVFAAKAGETALDGNEMNGPFAKALANRIKTPGLEVRRFFDVVRDDVLKSTGHQQQPFSYGSISGDEDFYFVTKN